MSIEKLTEYRKEINLVPVLEGTKDIGAIGSRVLRDFQTDESSIAKWKTKLERGRKLFRQDPEKKNTPWANASSVKYPLLTVAAIQFAARAYPAVVETPQPVRAEVIGFDPDGTKQERGFRVAEHMSWQLLNEMTEWEDDTDRLLHALPIDGCAFKKVYFDPVLGRNVSSFRKADDVIVNNDTLDILSCPCITEPVAYYPFEIQEKILSGEFVEIEGIDYRQQEPVQFLEQHCRIDLDDDGYPEPYIVVVTVNGGKVARIVANYEIDNIKLDGDEIVSVPAEQYFVKYSFIPDPEGGFYSIGFAQLLGPINDSVNSLLDQLIDAGHLANTGGGFIGRGVRIRSGEERFSPGEWKRADVVGATLKESIVPLPIQQPSQVLFQLLGLLIESAKEVSSVQDVMTGGGGTNMPATTVLAQIEQGMKVFTAIYKRIHRAFKDELKLIYRLNSKYLDDREYFTVMDSPKAIARSDYEDELFDIIPVSDPSLATDLQKMAKVQALMQMGPLLNQEAVAQEALRLMNIENPDKYLPVQQGPSPEQLEAMAELDIKNRALDIKAEEARAKALELAASAVERYSAALVNIAETDEKGADNILNSGELSIIVKLLETLKERNEHQGTVQGLVERPANNIVSGIPGGQRSGIPGSIEGTQGPMGGQPVPGQREGGGPGGPIQDLS